MPSPLENGTAPGETAQEQPAASAQTAKAKKKLVRRTERDYSQVVRRSYQAAFLLLNVCLGALFYVWVRGLETGTIRPPRSASARPRMRLRCPRLRKRAS
jgi:hypothetical protein